MSSSASHLIIRLPSRSTQCILRPLMATTDGSSPLSSCKIPISRTGTVLEDEFKDIVQEFARRIAGGHEVSTRFSEDGSFVIVQTRAAFGHEKQTALNNICQLQANWLPRAYLKQLSQGYSSEALEVPHPSTVNVNVAPPPPPQGDAPPNPEQARTTVLKKTLEVRGIPKGVTKEEVQDQLKKAAGSSRSDVEIDVRSLAACTERELCATFIVRQEDSPEKSFPRLPSRWTIHDHFLGITPLYDGGDSAEVDIVAVPGLGTHAISTFRPTGQVDVWLRDLLPYDLPNSRVLLYGYKSTVPGSNDTARAPDLADTLRNHLLSFRNATNTRERPVIFIAHSLGGILIKELLHQIEGNTAANKLYQACRGFLFFGVPNAGLKNKALAIMVDNQPNKPLIESLLVEPDGRPPAYLKLLDETFKKALQRLPIMPDVVAFYETLETHMSKRDEYGKWVRNEGEPVLMVPKESASLPLLGCTAERLDGADHSNLVKLKDRKGNYEIVLGKLSCMVQKIVKKKTNRMSPVFVP